MKRPIVWTIAGSDSGGGAGIQGDLKTMNALGVHGCSVITALTAQNTLGVFKTEPTSADMLAAQLKAVTDDLPPAVVKLGMLMNEEIVGTVASHVKPLDSFIICDPLITSSSGKPLLDEKGIEALVRDMFPHVDLLTPNIPEAARLLNREITDADDIEKAARDLLNRGVASVLIKGGHRDNLYSQDFWTNGREKAWLTSEMQPTLSSHGTGCALSSAIASFIALGYAELDAVVLAKAFVNQGLRKAGSIGAGRGPLYHEGWPSHPDDMPWITSSTEAGVDRPQFLPCERPLGLYPVVNRFAWVEKLLNLGVRTLQLRIKDIEENKLEGEIRQSIELARKFDAQLYINDYWKLAIEHDAYGVHLGQDDLTPAAIRELSRSRMRLGISTHSFAELAQALAYNPSYVAVGTIHHSPSKTFEHKPLGVEAFKNMRPLIRVPIVAIGGITCETAPELIAAGADGVAVITDVMKAENLEERLAAWGRLTW